MAVRAEPPAVGWPGPRDGYPTAAERPEPSDGPGTPGARGREGGASGSCRRAVLPLAVARHPGCLGGVSETSSWEG